jgi:hypothetical protein
VTSRGRLSLSIATLLAMAESNRIKQMQELSESLRAPVEPPPMETDQDRQARLNRLGRGPQRKCKRGRRKG